MSKIRNTWRKKNTPHWLTGGIIVIQKQRCTACHLHNITAIMIACNQLVSTMYNCQKFIRHMKVWAFMVENKVYGQPHPYNKWPISTHYAPLLILKAMNLKQPDLLSAKFIDALDSSHLDNTNVLQKRNSNTGWCKT